MNVDYFGRVALAAPELAPALAEVPELVHRAVTDSYCDLLWAELEVGHAPAGHGNEDPHRSPRGIDPV